MAIKRKKAARKNEIEDVSKEEKKKIKEIE